MKYYYPIFYILMNKKTGWPAKKWSREEEIKLKKLCKERKSYKEISSILNRSEQACKIRASKLKCNNSIRYTYDKSFFKKETEYSCYWAGFIAADGYIRQTTKGSWQTGISLAKKDRNHLERFVTDISFSGHVTNTSTDCRVIICGKELPKQLNRFNITKNKSLTLKAPNIKNQINRLAFIKGLIDGDGTIYIDKHNRIQFSIVGTKEILIWIQEQFDFLCPKFSRTLAKPRHRKDRTNKNHFTYKVTGFRALNILNKLCEIETPELERKWDCVRNYEIKEKRSTAGWLIE